MNSTYFGDLENKMKTGVNMATQHNNYAEMIYNKSGVILPRYDLLEVQSSILNAHRKFYGMLSKYDSNGKLVGGA